jgi:O-methyltransferase
LPKKICAAYLDVDLALSTKTCLKYIYPRITTGGILYSQDGDFPLVIDIFDDDNFWENEVGCKKPKIEGLRKSKILRIVKQ